ncbi:hypothetical protein QWY28_24335, partial [Nocardioides sp. SOB77]
PGLRLLPALVVALLLALRPAAPAGSPPAGPAAAPAAGDNPLAGGTWGVYRGGAEMAWAPYERATGRK